MLFPNAKIENVVGEHGGAIKIKLRARGCRKSERGARRFSGQAIESSGTKDRLAARSQIAR